MSQPPDSDNAPIDATLASLEAGFLVGNGRFTLVRLIGRGGMGVVWLARDESLHENVALKFLPPEIRFDAVALDDLRRETARARKLTHPNIVRIHDIFKDEREAFISMEFVDGPNLSDLRLEQRERFFTWKSLEPLVKQLCDALDYAHDEKVVHRDLKPANLMLDSRGRLKLSDFGIAAQVSDSVHRVSMIRHGQSGTVTYMSPQQMDGKLPQVSDDIYALGATLYELLTSRPPFFTGDIPYQVRNLLPQPIDERLAELEIENEVPKSVAALIMACLGKSPEQRPVSARAVAEWIGLQPAALSTSHPEIPKNVSNEGAQKSEPELERKNPAPLQESKVEEHTVFSTSVHSVVEESSSAFADEDSAVADTDRIRARVPMIVPIFVGLVVVGLGVGIFSRWLWNRSVRATKDSQAPSMLISSSEFLRTEHVLAGHSLAVSSVTFSPDQKFLISGSADGSVRIYETDRGELVWSAKADVGPITAVSVSREGKLLAAAGGTGLIRLFTPASGQVFQTLRIHSSPLTSAAFSPTSNYLVSADEAGTVALWDYEKGSAGKHWNAHNTPIRSLAFSPNGSQLATGGSQDSLIRIWKMPGGTAVKTLMGHEGIVWSLAYSADGSMLVSSSKDRSARLWNAGSFSLLKTMQWMLDAHLIHDIAFSPDSKFLAAGVQRGVKVFRVESAAPGTERMLKATSVMRCVTFSPDGSTIAAGGDDGWLHVWPSHSGVPLGATASDSEDRESNATPSAAAQWITLFDGVSLAAWHGWKGANWRTSWEVLGGELRSLRGDNVNLATRELFGDFELELEWKVAPGANSGIFYRVPPGASDLPKAAPEFQVVDDATRDGRNPVTTAGSIYNVVAPSNKRLASVGSFNTTRIVVRGQRAEHWLNGTKILEADLTSPAVQRVAVKKYQKGWGEAPQGQVVLQNLGNEVSFRNIRIRKLSGN